MVINRQRKRAARETDCAERIDGSEEASSVFQFQICGPHLGDCTAEAINILTKLLERTLFFQPIQKVTDLSSNFTGNESLATLGAHPRRHFLNQQHDAIPFRSL
jgi:hypothetical protein